MSLSLRITAPVRLERTGVRKWRGIGAGRRGGDILTL